jgi:hypothetical protein
MPSDAEWGIDTVPRSGYFRVFQCPLPRHSGGSQLIDRTPKSYLEL